MQDESSKLIQYVEESKHDPVGKPLFIVIGAFRLQCEEGHEARVGHGDGGGDVHVANAEHHTDDARVECIPRELVDTDAEHVSHCFHLSFKLVRLLCQSESDVYIHKTFPLDLIKYIPCK